MDRRRALRVLASGGAASTALCAGVEAAVTPEPTAPMGMLYDTTLCIGCKACVVACRDANALPNDPGPGGDALHQAPTHLSSSTKNIIKLWDDGTRRSFVKRQCMHCIDPACVSACMMKALKKEPDTGVVYWTGESCVGCRYCQIACPFGVPQFEWTALNPRIVKCELCRHRRTACSTTTKQNGFSQWTRGEGPACCEVCPRGAVIHGKRAELLAEAERRLAAHPDRYVPHIYGARDAGGTQVLYLSHVPFEKIELPDIGEGSLPEYVHGVQGVLYKGFVAPLALFGALAFSIERRGRQAQGAEREE